MTKISDRERLVRMTRGESFDNIIRYRIEYSLDIRGKITIWGGMDYLPEESIPMFDDVKKRVSRVLVPLYEYERESPYTARIFQMEQELDETISDEKLIGEFLRFREAHREDGFGFRLLLLNIGRHWCSSDLPTEEEQKLRKDRDDKQEVLDRLLTQERKDILSLWGVDCPPDINSNQNYNERLLKNMGQCSEWFKTEFRRIGGDYEKLWGRRRRVS